jgi:hypothetical protein
VLLKILVPYPTKITPVNKVTTIRLQKLTAKSYCPNSQEVLAPLPIIHQKVTLNIKFNARIKNYNQEKQRDFKGNLQQKKPPSPLPALMWIIKLSFYHDRNKVSTEYFPLMAM